MALYAVHPNADITAMQLAAAYGLTDPDDYIVVNDPQAGFQPHEYINLYPRDNGDYRDIKYELGDELDGVERYRGGYLWNEVKSAVERKKLTGEDRD